MANRFFEGAAHAAAYAKFRPRPPTSLVDRILVFLKEKYEGSLMAAADVGCGSGQSTQILAPHFASVTGLDISEAQTSEAIKLNSRANVFFKTSGAEKLPFPDNSLQLITAGQACHWFDLPVFYKEADRVLIPGGVLALYGYMFPQPIHGNMTDKLFEIVDHVYTKELGPYWGGKISSVDDKYVDMEIPYASSIRSIRRIQVVTGELTVKVLMLLIVKKSSSYLTQTLQGMILISWIKWQQLQS